jgi:transcriptional regulator with XRE-family HTH domain
MKKKERFRSLPEAIRTWIKENNFNLKAAAVELGIDLATLHNILHGKAPKRGALFRIAKRIDISNPHAYILAEVNRMETPDRIKELLWFSYEKTIDTPDINVAEVVKELYPW